MNKFLAAVLVLVAAVATVVFFYFRSLNNSRYQSQPFKAVPSSAAIVIDFHNSDEFFSPFRKNNILSDLFSDELNLEIKSLNSSFLQQADLRNVLKNERILVSVHVSRGKPALLFIIPLVNTDRLNKFFNNLKEDENTLKYKLSKIEDADVYSVSLSDKAKTFSFTSYKGLLLGSFDTDLLKESISVQRSSTDISIGSLMKVENTETTAIKASLYLNYKGLSNLAESYLNNSNKGSLGFVGELAKWSTLNLNYKNDALMFNGITTADLSTADYLGMFLNQKPQRVRIPSLLTDKTAFFVDFAISDYSQFKKDHKVLLGQSKKIQAYEKWIESFNKNYGLDIETEWPQFMGNEFGLAVYNSPETGVKTKEMAIIALSDSSKASVFLKKIAQTDKRKGISRSTIGSYKGYQFYYCGYPDLLSSTLGAVYHHIEWPYLTIVNNYLIAASSQSVLEQFIDEWLMMKLLDQQVDYQKFKQYINTESTIYFYLNFGNSSSILSSGGNEKLAKYLAEKRGLANYYGLTFQLSASGGQFFSNLNFLYQPADKEKQKDTASYSIAKSFDLDAELTGTPVLVRNESGTNAFVTFDKQNNLYYFDESGRLMWKVKLTESIMGSITPISYSGKPYMIFNTATKVFVIDENGKAYPRFPLSFKRKITVPVAVFDYDNNNDYRIVVPLADKSVSIFDLKANRLEGWNPKQNVGYVTQTPQSEKVTNSTYLFTVTDHEKYSFYDRKGKLIISGKLPERVNNSFSPLIGKTLADSRFVSTDTAGNIVTVFFDGRVRSKSLGSWSGEQFFALKNITGDSHPEYVFFDKNHLYVYTSNGSLVYDYVPLGEASSDVQFFEETPGKYNIGLHLPAANQWILLDENGEVAPGFPLKGSTSFINYFSTVNHSNYLIGGDSNKKLLIYKKN